MVDADDGKAITVSASFTDHAGNAEELTSAATAAVIADDPPPEPAALSGLTVDPVAGETTKLAVSWDAVADADKYLVRWKTGSADYNNGEEATEASHTITALSAGTAYTVAVSAIDTGADPHVELATGEADGTTLAAMGTVTAAAAADSSDSLDVSWPAVSGATGYKVEWKTGSGSYTAVTRSDATATSERLTGLDAETTYTVRVTARHTIGGQTVDGDSAEGSGTTNAADTPDEPLTTIDEVAPALRVSFSVGSRGTWYAWEAMETLGGNPVTGYTIHWSTSPDGPWAALDAPGQGMRCVPGMEALDEGNGCYFVYEYAVSPSSFTPGNTYYFRLIAHAGSARSAPGPVLEDTL